MATWLEQMNYPKVKVSLQRSSSDTIFNFEQSRFLYKEPDADVFIPDWNESKFK